jgi:hypothetical protein
MRSEEPAPSTVPSAGVPTRIALPPTPPPGLEQRDGERRDDCRHYAACLDRFTRAHSLRRDPPARCRLRCSAFEPIPDTSKLEDASWQRRSSWEAA